MTTPFPRARYIELSLAGADSAVSAEARARTEGSTALLIDAAMVPAPAVAQNSAGAAKNESAAVLPLALAAMIDVSRARDGNEACLDEDGSRTGGIVPLLCPSSPRGRLELSRSAAEAAQRGDAVVLDGIDRWYAQEPSAAGHCPHCERALVEVLRQSYGEQLQPFSAFELSRRAGGPGHERPFAGMRLATRLSEPLAAVRAAVLAARDSARKSRGAEIAVFARSGPLSALTLSAARHLDGLIFALTGTDPHEALLPLLLARAALGERAAIAELPAGARPDEVRLLAALATACDVDVLLPQAASDDARAALLAHRRFAALLRERYRPTAPVADVEMIVSPSSDHLSGGTHLRASTAAVAAIARAQLQLSVRLDTQPPTRDGPRLLVLAGAQALPDALAPALRRHVESGGDLLLIGHCDRVDEESRVLGPLFPSAKLGLERIGEGRIFSLAGPADPFVAQSFTQLDGAIQRALRELLGRTQRTLSISGRGNLWMRAYLDSERKLDVHLVNLELRDTGFVPAQGMLLQIAGAAAGAGRTGYWFSPERGGKDGEKIALNPSGFSVSTVLPAVSASALLSIPR